MLSRRFFKGISKIINPPKLKTLMVQNNFKNFATDAQLKIDISKFVDSPKAQITTLPNGLRVATESNPENKETASMALCVDVGSRYENAVNNGSAHFLEHLAFKGTQRRSRLALEREVENIGGHLNAYTSREQTTYFASVMKKYIPQAVDILSDIIQNSTLSNEAIENERFTILHETDEVYKDMQEYCFDYLHECAYLQNPLGQTILGPKENIKRLKRQDLLDFIRRFYLPSRMVLAAVGAVDHAELVRLAEKHFGSMKNGDPLDAPRMEAAKYTGSDYRERQDSAEMAHVAIAYETCGWKNPDVIPLMFLQTILGSWEVGQPNGEHSSSRLITTVSSFQYADRVMPFNTLYHDTGLFGIYASIYEARVLEMSNVLMKSFNDVMQNTKADQIAEARNRLITNAVSAMDSTTQGAEELGRQVMVYGRKIPNDEFIARVNAVDLGAVQKVARRYFYDKNHSMAAVGPICELPVYDWFRRRSYSMLS